MLRELRLARGFWDFFWGGEGGENFVTTFYIAVAYINSSSAKIIDLRSYIDEQRLTSTKSKLFKTTGADHRAYSMKKGIHVVQRNNRKKVQLKNIAIDFCHSNLKHL